MAGLSRRVPYPVQVALLAAAYFLTARISLLLAIPPGYATSVWPPSGIALAAIIMFGTRLWPGIWLGAALVNLAVAGSPFAALAIGTGNALEALAGAALMRRWIADHPPYFDRARNVGAFIGLAMLCPAVAASIGVLSLAMEGAVHWQEFLAHWWTWWHGDATGIIIVTPAILTWTKRHHIAWTPAKKLEAAAYVLSLFAVTLLIFIPGEDDSLHLTFSVLPFVIWAAFRFSRREVMTTIALISAIAIWATVQDRGPFSPGALNLSLLNLLAFISTVVATGLILSATVEERIRAMEKLEQALTELKEQAHTDPLTDLFNRRYLWDFLQREWIRARRRRDCLSVIMIDLDYFKQVNDRFGHDAGDRVLIDVANLLKRHIRGSDIACRFGGEEFALVLPDATPDAVQRRAEEIRGAVRGLELEHRGAKLGHITASFGIAVFPVHATDPESLLRAADEALYNAKGTGRDRIVTSPELPQPVKPVRNIVPS